MIRIEAHYELDAEEPSLSRGWCFSVAGRDDLPCEPHPADREELGREYPPPGREHAARWAQWVGLELGDDWGLELVR